MFNFNEKYFAASEESQILKLQKHYHTPGVIAASKTITLNVVDKKRKIDVLTGRVFKYNSFVGDYFDNGRSLTDELMRFAEMKNVKVSLIHG